jgi:hypothetical protein
MKGNFIAVNNLNEALLKILNIRPVKGPVGYYDKSIRAVVHREGYWEDEELGTLVEGENFFVPLDEIEEVARAKGFDVKVFVPWHGDGEGGRVVTVEGQGVIWTMIEKSDNSPSPQRKGFYWGRGQNYTCGIRLTAKCEHCGVEHIVRKPCGREWCPECGRPNSLYHRQVYLRILGYALEMFRMAGAVGYLVITCPEELREKWKDKKVLNEVVRYVRRMLEREGFRCGVYRWHFAGDKGRRWYPHLNILIPWGYMEPEKLERLKNLIYKRLGVKVVHYSFITNIAKLRHVARYIARPTWLLQNDVKPEDFKNFRKMGIWGKRCFESASMESPREIEDFVLHLEELISKGYIREGVEAMAFSVLHGRCAVCNRRLKWRRLKSWWLDEERYNLYKLGWGIWLVVSKEWSGEGPPPPPEPEDEEFWYF